MVRLTQSHGARMHTLSGLPMTRPDSTHLQEALDGLAAFGTVKPEINQTIGERREEAGFSVPTVSGTGIVCEQKGDEDGEVVDSVGRGERI